MTLIMAISTVIGVLGSLTPVPRQIRIASRAVMVNNADEVAFLYVARDKYHTIPGGEVLPRESLIQALYRELKEETGCLFDPVDDLGVVMERREEEDLLRVSYGFYGKAKPYGPPDFTTKEKKELCEIVWVPFPDALARIVGDCPVTVAGQYILRRDRILIQRAADMYFRQDK